LQARQAPPPDPFAFFQPHITISTGDRAALDRGQFVVRVQSEKDRRVSMFTAVLVHAGPDRLVNWIRHIDQWKKNPAVLGVGRFSSPARLADLDRLTLDSGDIDDLKSCKADDCALRLAPAEIAVLRAAAVTKAPPPGDVQTAFRRVLLGRVARYETGGHEHSFAGLWDDDAALVVDEFTYWSKEHYSGKPLITATHVRVLRSHDPTLPEVIVDERQVFATHYITESVSLAAMVRRGTDSGRYLAYLNRSQIDVLGGLFGGFVRMGIDRRLRAQAPGILRDLRARLESGEPVE
jgi:hypothetical protein